MNSRNKGIQWEQKIVRELKQLGFKNVLTTRNGSKYLDDKGVDLMNVPFHLQIKSGRSYVNYFNVLNRIEKIILDGKIDDLPFSLLRIYDVGKGNKRTFRDKLIFIYKDVFEKHYGSIYNHFDLIQVIRTNKNYKDVLLAENACIIRIVENTTLLIFSWQKYKKILKNEFKRTN